MKNRKRTVFLSFALTLCLLMTLFTGCAASAPIDNMAYDSAESMTVTSDYKAEYYEELGDYEYDMTTDAAAPMEGDPGSANGSSGSITVPDDGRKVVLTAEVRMEAKDYDTALRDLLNTVTGMGGYVSNREDYGYGNRETMLTLRIPSTHYADFIDGLPGIANVTQLTQSSQDITDSYIETESYLTSLTTQQDRLLELMEQAENLEDLLAIEDRLATVRAELQYYASLKNSYDNRLTYSTVTLTLWEVKDYTVVQPTFGEKLWENIKDSGEDFLRFLEDLLFFLIGAFPYLVLLIAAALIIRRTVKKRRAKKAAAQMTSPEGPAQ